MRIISWNVNGIRASLKKGLLDWLDKESPDILCLQETKASLEQLPNVLQSPKDYYAYYVSAEKKGYSGVSLFSKVEPKEVKLGIGIPEFDREGRVCIADYGNFVLLNIYFPNGKASEKRLKYKIDFYEAILSYFDDLISIGRKVIICGDVNTAHKEIDLARPRENSKVSGFLPIERAWIDKLLAHGFIDTFRFFNSDPGHYTWWDLKSRARSRNVGWRIDYFFISDNLKKDLKSAFIMSEVMGSDHCPIGIDLELFKK